MCKKHKCTYHTLELHASVQLLDNTLLPGLIISLMTRTSDRWISLAYSVSSRVDPPNN
jgi:hypothetical protein